MNTPLATPRLLALFAAGASLFAVACDGQPGVDGVSSLVESRVIPAGGRCAEGGLRFDFGDDWNRNGRIDADEVTGSEFVCNGVDGTDGVNGTNGVNGTDGVDGHNALVRVDVLAPDPQPGGVCWFGGVMVRSGTDLNANGKLEAEEITSESPVCSIHVNENKTLVEQDLEPPGDHCEYGGIIVTVGYDANGNEVLDADEAGQPGYVCNALTVVNGTSTLLDVADATGNQCAFGGYILRSGPDDDGNGQLSATEIVDTEVVCNGNDGVSTLVTMVPATAHCGVDGGYIVASGLDTNYNNTLDADEIQTSSPVCHGADGQDGFLGYDGKNSLIRLRPDNGACGPVDGFVLETGLDLNEDGTLNGGEVEAWEVVCDGYDGMDGLVEVYDDTQVCTYGGVRVESGLDADFDGYLDSNEVTHEAWICDGYDGYTSLVDVQQDPFECEFGGVWVASGLDLNDNGWLDNAEIESEVVICQ